MLASTLELHNPTERDKFNFLSFSSARPIDLARNFKEILANATNKEGKQQLARIRKVYGNKLIKDFIALLDWLEGMNEQFKYNLEQFLTFNPYHAERFLPVLPALGENFLDFVTVLDDGRGEDGLVTPKQIRDLIRQFLPARAPRPKFDPGTELTDEHFTYFKRKILGKSRKAEVLAEKEALFNAYLSAAEGIANGRPLKVEHLAEAIARRGDDPAALLPRPSRQFTIWNARDFLLGNETEAVLEDPSTDGNEVIEEEIVSVTPRFEYAANPSLPDVPESGKAGEAPVEFAGIEESDNEFIAFDPAASKAIVTDTVESPNRDIPFQPVGNTPVETIRERSVSDILSPETVPVTRAAGSSVTPSKSELSLRPGARVRTTGSGEVGRLLKKTGSGWLVKFKGGLNRILPAERLVALPDRDPVAVGAASPSASARASNNAKPKNSKKKNGFGLSVA
jgi:hypothetical protein